MTAAEEGKEERSKLAGRAGIVGLGTLASRLLGLARDMALAALFTRAETDAFWVAFRIPNALRMILGEGAVSAAVIPVLSEKLAREGESSAQAFYARIRGISLLALAVVSLIGVVFAGPITELFAHGYHARPGEFERTVTMTRIVFPYIFFMGTAALGMAALHTHRKFAVASFAPALLNVAFLIAAFLLPSRLQAAGMDRSYAIVIGAVIGGPLQVIAQWPALKRMGYLMRPVFDLRDPGVRQVMKRMIPMAFGIGVYYIDQVLSARFLSESEPGGQSYYAWAMRLCDFPQGIFVMAISTAALPSLSSLAAKKHIGELIKTYAHGLRLALFVAIPASVALAVIGEPLVAMLFQRGNFDAIASAQTARSLVWQGGAIWTVAAVRQVIPVFNALEDTRTPVIVSAIDLVAFIGLALLLKDSMGHVGISIATAGSSFVQMALLFFALKQKLGTICAHEIALSVSKTLLASLFAGACAWALSRLIDGTFARGLVAMSVFCAVFLIAAWGARSMELEEILTGLRRRFLKGK